MMSLRKQAHDSHLLRPVLDAIGVGIVVVEESGEIVLSNSAADELLARRVGRATLLDVLVESALAELTPGATPWSAPHPSETPQQRRVEASDASGLRSVVGYRVVRDRRLGMIITLRDITEIEAMRANERQLERLSEVGRACAMVAHEIGNPLAAIKATIQSIESEAAAAGLQDPISAVFLEVQRLDKILHQLLGFVRHRTPRRGISSLPAIVAKARAASAPRMKHVTVRSRLEATGPIYVDADQLTQVLTNLFINAADAMPDGGVLSISAESDEATLLIRIEDEGIGIPRELRGQVFEAFYTTKQQGTGLGLSICYRIVSDHGGSIAIEDPPSGKGTCFLLTLPKATVADS